MSEQPESEYEEAGQRGSSLRGADEDAMSVSEQRLRWALHAAVGGTWDWDLVTGEAWWSPEMYELWGIAPGTRMLLENSLAIVRDEDREGLSSAVKESIARHTDLTHEFRIDHAVRGERWMVLRGHPFYDDSGRPVRVLGITLDITERKQMEEELRRLSHFPEENPNPVLRCGCDGRLLYANSSAKGWLTSLGWQPDGLLPESVRRAAEKASGRDRSVETEITDPYDRTCSISAVQPPGTDYINLYVRDVTERRRAEKEREDLIARLETQNAELERFTYTVSHDLKSPLITIKGFAGMVSQDLAGGDLDAAWDGLARISKAADTMETLLHSLLELSRIGRLMNSPEEVALDELVGEVLEIIHGQIDSKGVRIDVSPSLPIVYGDRIRLLEVLQNLLNNAVKYMGDTPDPHIGIGVRQDGNDLVCYVRDNGIGIDPRYHDRVFGLFDQLDPNADGTGIGLALVKRIIEVHGGRIWAESEGKGHGSTFCFVIPAKPAEMP